MGATGQKEAMMILALNAALALAHVDLPRPPMAVSEAARTWRTCVSDGMSRRADLTRGGSDVYELASVILAECRPAQDAVFAARAQWVEGLDLSPEEQAAALRRNERDVRSMHDMIIMRARRYSRGSEQDWE